MAYNIATILDSAGVTQPAATVPTAEAVAQHGTGKTNASASPVGTALNVWGGAILVVGALLVLWLGGGIAFKGL